ncbi:Lsr2 family DNA-binding protein [Kineococcus gypseus]|uniref:Lsr2 family DNA-binding protein n=1 Tax=Kineococcus gypseus TaxID=1637102 RepID=UPI003D7CDCC1
MAQADHAVSLSTPTAIAVGSRAVELPVRRGGRRVGVLTVSGAGVRWEPATSRPAVDVSWEDLPSALASVAPPREARAANSSGARRGSTRAARQATGRPGAVPNPSAGTGADDGGSVHVPGQQPLPLEGLTAPATDGSGTETGSGSNGSGSNGSGSTGSGSTGSSAGSSTAALVGGAAAGAASGRTPVVDLAGSASTSEPVPAARGAVRAGTTRRSAKKAPPRRAGEPAAREVTSAPARAASSTVPAAGADTARLDARAVRRWAAANGIDVPPRGPLSAAVRERYLAAR